MGQELTQEKKLLLQHILQENSNLQCSFFGRGIELYLLLYLINVLMLLLLAEHLIGTMRFNWIRVES